MGAKLSKSHYSLVLGYSTKSRHTAGDGGDERGEMDESGGNVVGVLEPNALLLGHLMSVEKIELCTKDLVSLTANIGLLSQAVTLQLCCNHLSAVPAEVGHLKNLTNLTLSRNQLTELPESIGFLSNLVELRASSNRLCTLPKSIIALQKLHTLSIENNLIGDLPVEVSQLANLVTLDLSGNPLQVLPAEIMRLKKLRRIRLDNCPLAVGFADPVLLFSAPSLKELAARVLVRNNWPVYADLQQSIRTYLLSVQECSFCGGPFFEHHVERGKMVHKNEFRIPVLFRLCCAHWNSEEQRVRSLFATVPATAPQYALTKSPSSGSLMNYFSYYNSRRSGSGQGNLAAAATASRSSRDSLAVPLATLAPSPSLPMLPNHSRSGLRNRSASTLELASYEPSSPPPSSPDNSSGATRPRSKSFSNLLKRLNL